jgi:G:T-mismatch repair DNA endonuclease (very short patch repair protein)
VCSYKYSKKQGCPSCQSHKTYSQNQIKWLNFIQIFYNINIQHAENGGEFCIPETNYKADGYCKETNTIYEYHGDYWHGNPIIYNKEQINKSCKKSFGKLYQMTLEREIIIKKLGYKLIIIWENDWKKISKSIKLLQHIFRNKKN